MREIEAAFAGVTRNEGMSLHQTIAADNYGDAEEFARMRALDTDGRWQDVRDEDLVEVSGIGGMSFFDDIGWRYHLPAYLRWWLVGDAATGNSIAASGLLFHLDMNPDSDDWQGLYAAGRLAVLNAPQRRCVAKFLRWIERFDEETFTRQTARHALQRLWSQFE